MDGSSPASPGGESPHLVAIKPTGRRLPFFCVHSLGGNVLNYRVLAAALHREQPLFGVQARGLDGLERPLGSIEEMARAYLRAIKSRQPVGPYLLGGGSLGGMIALEIAQQMQRSGDPVKLLVMFDTIGPNHPAAGSAPASRPLGRLGQRLAGRVSPGALWRGVRRREGDFRRLLRCRAAQLRGVPIGHELRYWYLERANLAAIRKYRPRPFDGRIHLIRGSLEKTGLFSDPERGWGGWATGGIVVSTVEGRHESLVEVAELGVRLRELLDEANG